MPTTIVDNIDAKGAKAKVFTALPTVYEFYDQKLGAEANAPQWVGGELVFLSTHNKLYIQTATSGTTATWKRTSSTWATTTSTSTSTTSSTTSSSSTSTSTSTTTSTTSSSTSTSSTTTA